jgi:molecular chaperone DnaJ
MAWRGPFFTWRVWKYLGLVCIAVCVNFGTAFDPYRVLGLSPDMGEKDIKSAYRKLALVYHPDKVKSEKLKRSRRLSSGKPPSLLSFEVNLGKKGVKNFTLFEGELVSTAARKFITEHGVKPSRLSTLVASAKQRLALLGKGSVEKYKDSVLRENVCRLSEKEAEEKFLEISQAYKMLKDKPRNEDTYLRTNVDMHQFFSGKPIHINHARRKATMCPVCHGSGAPEGHDSPHVCDQCGGHGHVQQTWGCHHGLPCLTFRGRCPKCGGAGKIGHVCHHCQGTGVVHTHEELSFNIPPGPSTREIRRPGEGDAALNRRPGDFVFQIGVNDHPYYKHHQDRFNDLVYLVEVPVLEARKGFRLELPGIEIPENIAGTYDIAGDESILIGQVRRITVPNFTPIGSLHVECVVVQG